MTAGRFPVLGCFAREFNRIALVDAYVKYHVVLHDGAHFVKSSVFIVRLAYEHYHRNVILRAKVPPSIVRFNLEFDRGLYVDVHIGGQFVDAINGSV